MAKGWSPFAWGFGAVHPNISPSPLPPKAAKNNLATALTLEVYERGLG